MRKIPNPQSSLLASAVVGGAGLCPPPNRDTPQGMAAILLYVPIEQVVGKTIIEIQNDLGLPWHAEDSPAVWFDDIIPKV